MEEKIGNVVMDLSYYKGEDVYNDGDAIEEEMLAIAKNYTEDQYNKVIAERKEWPILYHFSHIRENILNWVPITKEDTVLEIGSGCGAVTGAIARKAKSVTCIDLSKRRCEINAHRHKDFDNIRMMVGNFEDIERDIKEKYNYITLIGVFEYASAYLNSERPYEDFLRKIEKHLAPGGRILIAIENRLGLKYFAGCLEDHTGVLSEGLKGYAPKNWVKTFSRQELSRVIEKAGFMDYRFYYPYPDYKFPMAVYSDEYLPKKGELSVNDRNFDRDRIKMFDELEQFDETIEDRTFPKYSNSFFVMIEKDEVRERDKARLPFSGDEIAYVKFSNERSSAFNIQTLITEAQDGKKKVWKTACDRRGAAHVERMSRYYEKKRNQKSVLELTKCSMLKERGLVSFEYVTGQTLADQLDAILSWNRLENGHLSEQGYNEIKNCMVAYFKLIARDTTQASWEKTEEFKTIFGDVDFPSETEAAADANIDMIPDNILFTSEGNIRVIDYEWTFDFPIPYQYILYRAVHYYVAVNKKRQLVNEERLLSDLGFTEEFLEKARLMEQNFQKYIRKGHKTLLMLYHDIHGEVFPVEELVRREQSEQDLATVQVYYDHGNGYREADSHLLRNTRGRKRVDLMLLVEEGVCGLRIDPARTCCDVSIQEIYAKTSDGYSDVEWEANGIRIERNRLLFTEPDPQICIRKLPENCQSVCVQMEINIERCSSVLTLMQEKYKEMEELLKQKDAELLALRTEHDRLAESYRMVRSSNAWKATEPLRTTVSGLKCLKEHGISYTMEEWNKKKGAEQPLPDTGRKEQEAFEQWLKEQSGKARKEKKKVSGEICFSILVPLYNTPEKFLRQMLKSVRHQSYKNWELCLADGSDSRHGEVERICRAYMQHDGRIKYKRLKDNRGISGNTNECMAMAEGDYIGLFDHDDLLDLSVLNEMAYAIETEHADYLYTDEYVFEGTPFDKKAYHFKPDYAPDSLRGNNYICHFSVFSRELQRKVGEFDPECDGSQDHDFILRLTEQAEKIKHIAKPLYYWRSHPESVASDVSAKSYVADSGIRAVEKHLERVGLKGTVESSDLHKTSYRIRYEIEGKPLVSILIPNKDHVTDLVKCLESIEKKSTYDNYEILVIENNSTMPETFVFYEELKKAGRARVVRYQGDFNYSAINNLGAAEAKGEYLILLNNDTEVISPDWIEEMLMYAQRKDVGAVGAMLYYPDDTIQHSGVVVGIGGFAGHVHVGFPKGSGGYMSRMAYAGNYSAVTAACMMVRKEVFDEVSGLSEDFKVAFNDVDLCLKIREKGYLVVFNPYAELYHYESKSRGYETTPEKKERFDAEVKHFKERWSEILEKGDPYFNPNLTPERGDFYPKELL